MPLAIASLLNILLGRLYYALPLIIDAAYAMLHGKCNDEHISSPRLSFIQ